MSDAPSPDEPEICSCVALRQAARHLTRLYDAALAPVDLGLNQFAVLARLKRVGPMRLSDLAGRLAMDRSSLGHLVRPLQARGLVAMDVGTMDRRCRMLTLTVTGEAVTARARVLWETAERDFATSFGTAEAAGLRAVLKRVERVEFEKGPA